MKNKNRVLKTLKIIGISLGSILGVIILTIGTYFVYVIATYYRIEDNLKLEIKNNKEEIVAINQDFTLTTYNIGFGAYSKNYSFFLDEGIDVDGTLLYGHYGKGISYDDVLKNTNGSVDILKQLDSDFVFIQEVDQDSDRAYHINQQKIIESELSEYASTYAINFHSAYLAYPLYDNHGKSIAGQQTLSKYKIEDAIRKSYVISDAFPDKFFDLDRCFSVHYIPTSNDKKLVLINSHMSAYDEGGKIRNKQIEQLNEYIINEFNNGNYVIVGGDFNHDLLTNNPMYPQYDENNLPFKESFKQQKPNWVSFIFNEDKESIFDKNFTIIAANDVPSIRGCDRPYQKGYTYVSSVDGFIVSNNVKIKKTFTTPTKDDTTDMFAFSDHQPTTIEFELI